MGVACPGRTVEEGATAPHRQRHITHTLANVHPPRAIVAPHLHSSNLVEGPLDCQAGVPDPDTIPSLPLVQSGTELVHAPLLGALVGGTLLLGMLREGGSPLCDTTLEEEEPAQEGIPLFDVAEEGQVHEGIPLFDTTGEDQVQEEILLFDVTGEGLAQEEILLFDVTKEGQAQEGIPLFDVSEGGQAQEGIPLYCVAEDRVQERILLLTTEDD